MGSVVEFMGSGACCWDRGLAFTMFWPWLIGCGLDLFCAWAMELCLR